MIRRLRERSHQEFLELCSRPDYRIWDGVLYTGHQWGNEKTGTPPKVTRVTARPVRLSTQFAIKDPSLGG